MKNILLTISYDGTSYCGWQRQTGASDITAPKNSTKQGEKHLIQSKSVKTVQGVLEDALSKVLRQRVALTGSGRTDSGVHAMGQAANFFCPIDSFPCGNFPRALNNQLPCDIRVVAAREVGGDFSARFSATRRTYRYFITGGPCNSNERQYFFGGESPIDRSCDGGAKSGNPITLVDAITNRYCWDVGCALDIGRLNEVGKCLFGEVDFKTFCAAGDGSLSTKRYVESARFFYERTFFNKNCVVFEITANAFLYHMIRSLVGTFVELSKKNRLDEFGDILHSCNRNRVLTTAPAKGLFLWSVNFSGVRRH